MPRPFTLLLVHHTHTDIGYTEVQHRVERWHADFLRQALDAVEARPDFRWVSETFWAVERFWAVATAAERARFASALRSGRIGLSASYLNFSELLDADVLRAVTARAGRFGRAVGVPVRSAMTADVNGFGWGFAEALLDAGAENLCTCVHTHHGRYPLGRTQEPFWWETPRGRRLLVWSGEHYHIGNELGLVPGAASSYLIKDECDAETIFHDARRVAGIRIPRYVSALRARGYAYDFAPVMASGLRNDNAPPQPLILDAIEEWNASQGPEIRVEMATLDDLFRRVRDADVELPVHRGDWPDWWSDGPASRPAAVRYFRSTQRDLARLRALRERLPDAVDGDVESIETDLAMFAEHTFSHSDSMAAPWLPAVHAIDATKEAFVARAAAAVGTLREAAAESLGGSSLRPGLPLVWRVLNPHLTPVAGLARLAVGHYEFHERRLDAGFEVWDPSDPRTPLAAELAFVPRGAEILVRLELAAGAERRLELRPAANGRTAPAEEEGASGLETDTFRVVWDTPRGIRSIVDRASGRELQRSDAPHTAFQPTYDATPVAARDEICAVRGRMGLNRKGPDARSDAGALLPPGRRQSGEVLESVTLEWDLDGTRFGETELRAHRAGRRLDATLRIHKESVWAPENVYAALPFSAGTDAVMWIDKAGAVLRPRIDQIPGTLVDFYALQAGWASIADDFGLVVLMPDQHLLQLGPLAHETRRLAGDPDLRDDPAHAYAWLMNNFWETNFAADLGGFYEFGFTLLWGPEYAESESAFARARATQLGFEVIRLISEVPA